MAGAKDKRAAPYVVMVRISVASSGPLGKARVPPVPAKPLLAPVVADAPAAWPVPAPLLLAPPTAGAVALNAMVTASETADHDRVK